MAANQFREQIKQKHANNREHVWERYVCDLASEVISELNHLCLQRERPWRLLWD